MPYIPPDQRNLIDPELETLTDRFLSVDDAALDGTVNYVITKIIHEAFKLKRDPSYKRIARAIAALECAKLELYRKIATPYEDGKAKENGEV